MAAKMVAFNCFKRLYSRVNIRKNLGEPQKIARKRFMTIFWCLRSDDEHTKICKKSDHGKWSNFGGKKDGRQSEKAWNLEMVLLEANHVIIC